MAAALSFNAEPAFAGRPRRKTRQSRWENLSFVFAGLAALGFFAATAVQSVSRSVTDAAHPALAAVTMPVTVHHGDTLWGYAQKYGATNAYILDRMETIAAVNHIAPNAALVPGQHLRVPVTNPIVLAQLERGRRLASAKR